MTRPPRRTSARRRDDLVQRIRTNEVRYPKGISLDLADIVKEETPETGGLRPARDTGLAIEGRAARESRRRQRENRTRVAFFAGLVVLAVVATAGWRYSSDQRAKNEPLPGATREAAGDSTLKAASNAPVELSADRAADDPTPMFASLGSVQIRLPVPVDLLTEVGFHQASNNYALHMDTPLPDANMKEAKTNQTTGRDLTAQESGPAATLVGSVLRMWRNRPGEPDSAVDVGALPSTDVYAPVTGSIVKIKQYKLYGKYDDFEIHIRPTGRPDIDCVMIHVDDLSCEVGDEVSAGVTRIAAIRKLSDRIPDIQLSDYTGDGGDHVHVQFNDAEDSHYKGLEGAVSADGS